MLQGWRPRWHHAHLRSADRTPSDCRSSGSSVLPGRSHRLAGRGNSLGRLWGSSQFFNIYNHVQTVLKSHPRRRFQSDRLSDPPSRWDPFPRDLGDDSFPPSCRSGLTCVHGGIWQIRADTGPNMLSLSILCPDIWSILGSFSALRTNSQTWPQRVGLLTLIMICLWCGDTERTVIWLM